MRDVTGTRCIRWRRSRPGPYRVGQWLPRRESYFRVLGIRRWFLFHWKPFQGLWIIATDELGVINGPHPNRYPRPEKAMLKRRAPLAGPKEVKIALPCESVILCDLPLLREHCSATTYADGGVRQPGYFWVMNRETCYEVLVFDPDAGARLPCRGASYDAAFLTAEKLLGCEDAPWEQDKYLSGRLAEKKPRAKKGS